MFFLYELAQQFLIGFFSLTKPNGYPFDGLPQNQFFSGRE